MLAITSFPFELLEPEPQILNPLGMRACIRVHKIALVVNRLMPVILVVPKEAQVRAVLVAVNHSTWHAPP